VLVGRGTTDPDANGEIAKLARMVQEGMGFGGVKVCFSGTATPLVRDGLSQAAGWAGSAWWCCRSSSSMACWSSASTPLPMNWPREPGVEVLKAAYLGVHAHVADVMLERARAVEGRRHELHAVQVPRADRRFRTAGRRAAARPSLQVRDLLRASSGAAGAHGALRAASHRSRKHGDHPGRARLERLPARTPDRPAAPGPYQRRLRRGR
jgi:hypothetical protein